MNVNKSTHTHVQEVTAFTPEPDFITQLIYSSRNAFKNISTTSVESVRSLVFPDVCVVGRQVRGGLFAQVRHAAAAALNRHDEVLLFKVVLTQNSTFAEVKAIARVEPASEK